MPEKSRFILETQEGCSVYEDSFYLDEEERDVFGWLVLRKSRST